MTDITKRVPFWQTKRFQKQLNHLILYIVLTCVGLIFILPLFWMLSTGLKTQDQLFRIPITWIPNPVAWDNFIESWSVIPFFLYMRNSFIIAGSNIAANLLVSPLIGFAFARIKFKGKNVLFILVLTTMLLPIQITIIPLFYLYKNLGWIDSFLPLIVYRFAGGNPFFIFLMRQFFLTIPKELEDAARIDGCSTFGIYVRIFLPLAKPALATIAIFVFMWNWNDFFGPLVYLQSERLLTLTIGLAGLGSPFNAEFLEYWNLTTMVAFWMLVPCLILFLGFQRFFVKGIQLQGLKQ